MTTPRTITLLDLFSGIGGFHAGLERAGFHVEAYYSEIDKHASAIYRKQFPHATALGSVTDVRRDRLPGHIDIISFGSPCQGFSNAGRNGGLSDERSGLVRHAIRLIAECRPRFFIWENVKGAISAQHSADFWAVVQCLANIGGYRLEWQLLNTEWVLPQNRERIYLVGHLAAPDGGFAPVFPFREGDSILGSGIGQGQKRAGERPASAITSTYHKGVHGRGETFIKVPSATASGYEVATEGDSINLAQFGSHTRRGRVGHGKAHTLDTSTKQGVMVPGINCINPDESQIKKIYGTDGISPCIMAGKGGYQPPRIMNLTPGAAQDNRVYDADGIAPCLMRGSEESGVTIPKIEVTHVADRTPAHTSLSKRYYGTEGVSHTLNVCSGVNIEADTRILGYTRHPDGSRTTHEKDVANTIHTGTGSNGNTDQQVVQGPLIRRLTEIECERLQGFPDDWTKLGDYDGTIKEVASTNRYKCLGNAVTVDIVRIVAERLHAGFALWDLHDAVQQHIPAPMPQFDGATYTPATDHSRLAAQYTAAFTLMADGKWRTLREMSEATGYPEASLSARLRDMRKPKFGSHTVDRRHRAEAERGIYEYMLIPTEKNLPSGATD